MNGWAGKGEGQEWSLCCSTFEGCDTPAKFHAGCDTHTPTLTVAHNAGGTQEHPDCDSGDKDCKHNPGNFTFGGFVRIPSTRLRAAILAFVFWPFVSHFSPVFCRGTWPWVPAWGLLEPPRRDGENV